MGQGFEALSRLVDAHQFQQFQGARGGRLAGDALVQGQHFLDLLGDVVQRVQRGHRLLEYHRDTIAADASQVLFVQFEQVMAGILDAAAGMAGQRVGQQAQDRMGRH
jgi:hypothetical protein